MSVVGYGAGLLMFLIGMPLFALQMVRCRKARKVSGARPIMTAAWLLTSSVMFLFDPAVSDIIVWIIQRLSA